ncbi:4-alpha-glucanotransferase [Butyricicoccus sp.]|uniref:4-alpha-glucanotransferase n=1 Tax=Butyricicoccus sp. TaxID=2049021 RepID=UPI003F1885F2
MRSSGVLMPLSSLPSPYGIGTIGQAAREFVDFLKRAGQSYWQILPICPTSYGDSPYQSFSTFAGNPYFIDLDELSCSGLLEPEEYAGLDWGSRPDRVDYGIIYQKRYGVLQKAAERASRVSDPAFDAFCKQNAWWLDDYALFMTIKAEYNGLPWMEWDEPLRRRDPEAIAKKQTACAREIAFWKTIQFFFYRQWYELRQYANDRGISIIGDIPIYIALDSVDTWAHPELFQLDENQRPRDVSGCPPDGFSDDGQLWGNPLFDWDYMKQDGYAWWIQRIDFLCRVYNVLRIDHFRGFDSYYAIPYGSTNAAGGIWHKGPGMELFRAVEQTIGRQHIIAEDLGFLTDSVRQMLKESGFPGMKVLEFAFDSRDQSNHDYLPHNYTPHCVAYTGTHDNDTIQGWMTSAAPEDIARAREYLHLDDPENDHWNMMKALWSTVAELTIVQAQDLLGLGSESRMNTPSTTENNWQWRAVPGSFDDALADKIRHNMVLYERL